jgi:radical SAM superfamily enzyme YgiQ (UPF0313 family)
VVTAVDRSRGRLRVALVNTNLIHPPIAPIAFDYLYEPLCEAGFEPVLLDLCFSEDWQLAIANQAAHDPPAFWGVTFRNTDDTYFAGRHSFIDLVRNMIAEIRRHSSAPIVMGGVGFSVMPRQILEYCDADFGIVREGEATFPALLHRLSCGKPHNDLPGLVYRDGGTIHSVPPAVADLSTVTPHQRIFVDNDKYFARGGMVAVETKRGCNRSCIYCVEPSAKGRAIRLRPPNAVVDEIERLADRGLTAFHINDSEFNLDVEAALGFCREIIRRGQLSRRIRWFAYGMPHPFPAQLAEAMVEAGCAGMNFGTDSADDRILRAIRRTFRRRHIAGTIETCRKLSLPYLIELLFGFPEETLDTVRATVRFLQDCDVYRASMIAGIRVFPGTYLETIVRAEGISLTNTNLHGVVEGNESLLKPLFYLTSNLGPDPIAAINALVADDPRFLPVNFTTMNYDDNRLLIDAIANGARGAYWAILEDLRNSAAASSRS